MRPLQIRIVRKLKFNLVATVVIIGSPLACQCADDPAPLITQQGSFEGVMWQAVETTNCPVDKLHSQSGGIFETNSYEVAIPKTGPPMMQRKHVLPVSAPNGHRVGKIRGRCFTEFAVIHFAEGDCLTLTDLAVYGTGDIEYKDHFYVFSKGHIVELLSDGGSLAVSGDLRTDEVTTDAAVRGKGDSNPAAARDPYRLVERAHSEAWISSATRGKRKVGTRLLFCDGRGPPLNTFMKKTAAFVTASLLFCVCVAIAASLLPKKEGNSGYHFDEFTISGSGILSIQHNSAEFLLVPREKYPWVELRG